ncbi:MAG: MltA domain-containing protein [Aquabacterium sp.]
MSTPCLPHLPASPLLRRAARPTDAAGLPARGREPGWRRGVVSMTLAAGVLALAACATGPKTASHDQPAAPDTADQQAAGPDSQIDASKAIGQDLATRHALFKVSAFDSLPGWRQDNFTEAWSAFKESCKALERKPAWKPLCAQVRAIKDAKAGRQFMEREFSLLTVQNTDRTRDGEITGYYEPMLQGRLQREGQFAVPIYGVPNDMYFLDWKTVPAAQRKGVTYVRASSRLLVPAQQGQAGTIAVDLRRFTLDTLDRRLRVRVQGSEGLPYFTRAELARQAALDAPVLAWVDDPIALYAMQVQGTGRIRLPDGKVIRLAYADQNGHPFKPMQLAAQGNERVQTRGKGDPNLDEVEHFDLADPADPADASGAVDDTSSLAEPLTRGARKPASAQSQTPNPAQNDVDATVDSLMPSADGKTASSKGDEPLAISPPAAGAATAGSQQLVDDLLNQAQKPNKNARKPAANAAGTPARPAASSMPAVPTATAKSTAASGGLSAAQSQRNRALESDPSYVFFRVAPDQSSQLGPVGALGVPLTAGRSLAVDPRVLPLGYPVFLDAAPDGKRQQQMQRLMFAQDTGGAIRGAVRADYFWGFGADAGKQARRTKHKGRMWVLVPHAEVEALLSAKLVTRGGKALGASGEEQRECLIDDETFCDAADPNAP